MLQINTTSTFAFIGEDQIACGTVAGALDDNFDSTSQLKIYNTTTGKAIQTWQCNSKFNSLSFSQFKGGVIVGGLENGEVQLYVPNKADPVFTKQGANGPIRGLDTNQLQSNLFASASRGDDLNIWDINNLSTPYSPGQRTPKLSGVDISCLKWNNSIPHILASSGINGYTVIWDLKNKREVISLQPHSLGQSNLQSTNAIICEWHPTISTQIMTASMNDSSPIITNWDLRNSQQPLYQLPISHQKGIISMSWNPKDPDLLLTSSKDLSTIIWDLNYKECVGELEHSNKWVFKVSWHPIKPWLFATSSYDGLLTIHDVEQPASLDAVDKNGNTTPIDAANDPFASIKSANTMVMGGINLRRPPQWYRNPVCSVFGYNHQFLHIVNRVTNIHSLDCNAPLITALNTLNDENVKDLVDHCLEDNTTQSIRSCLVALRALSEGGRALLVEYLCSLVDKEIKSDIPLTAPDLLDSSSDKLDEQLHDYLLLGQFHNACMWCIENNLYSDAFMIAGCQGTELYQLVRLHYIKYKQSNNAATSSVSSTSLITSIINASFVEYSHANNVLDSLILVLTYGDAEQVKLVASVLQDRLVNESADTDQDLNLHLLLITGILNNNAEKVIDMLLAIDVKDYKLAINIALATLCIDYYIGPIQLQVAFIKVIKKTMVMEPLLSYTLLLKLNPPTDDSDGYTSILNQLQEYMGLKAEYTNTVDVGIDEALADMNIEQVSPQNQEDDRYNQQPVGKYNQQPVSQYNQQPENQYNTSYRQSQYQPPMPQQQQSQYQPPMPQQQQAGYQPPMPQQQTGYQPPMPQQQSQYQSPMPQQQAGYQPPMPQQQSQYQPPMPQQQQTPYQPPMPQQQSQYQPPMPQQQQTPYQPPMPQQQSQYNTSPNQFQSQYTPPASQQQQNGWNDAPPMDLNKKQRRRKSQVAPPQQALPQQALPQQTAGPNAPPRKLSSTNTPAAVSSNVPSAQSSATANKYRIFNINIANGDRTHISNKCKPIFMTLSAIMGVLIKRHTPPQKRIVMDIEKRLNELFDKMNNDLLSEPVTSGLLEISKYLENKDFQNALQVQTTMSTTYMQEGHWLVGIRRLIDQAKMISK
eukprot:NODE_361_length_10144_cov_0.288402.p1 type:complete len:1094 gc:universal NODE_361_length_10144_cov_0.288402:3096-6377(+)